MKLRYLLMTALAAAATLFVSCDPEEELVKRLDGIKLGSTYITIAKGETTATTTMSINEAWSSETPEWLTLTPASGDAGDYDLTFTALADTLDKGSVLIKFGSKVQSITVIRDGDKPKVAGVLFEEPFIGHGQGDFEIKNIVGAPWSYDAKYGMKATAYINNANTDADSYLVSPEIDLTEETVALLSFEQAVNYCSAPSEYLSVEVTEDNGATWTKVEVPEWPAGSSWDFLASGDVDLSAYLGKKIKFAFHYTSNTAASPTWEVKNVKIANVAGAVPPELTLDINELKLGAKDNLSGTITATTNGTLVLAGPFSDADCTTEIAAADAWLTVSPLAEGVATVTAEANEGDVRKAYLKFSSTNEFGTTDVVATVEQAAGLASYPLPFTSAFTDGQGSWEIHDVVGIEGKNIWVQNNTNGMVAKAGSAVVSESELISPLFDLTAAASPVLTFQHVHKFAGNFFNEMTLYASIDNGTTWTELQIPHYAANNNWTWVSSGKISLARFAGSLARIKFVYRSNTAAYATWEIKDLEIKEDAEFAPTCVAELNNFAASAEASWSGTFTDAVVSYDLGGNAFIEDATGGVQLFKNNHGLAAGQKISGQVSGKIKLYNGFAELTDLDVSAATVTDGEVPAGTVLTIDQLLAGYLHWQNMKVVLENVTLDAAIDKGNNRKANLSQDGTETKMALYAQTKTITMPADVKGTLTCWPSRYNATLQVGVFADANFVAAAAPAPAITIDGDMSDWDALADDKVASVIGEENYDYMALKVTYDADNLYFYSKRNLARQSEWPFYIWYKIDINGAGTYAKAFWFYPYVKDTELAINPSPESQEISGLTLSCAAYAVDSTVEIEVSVPRSQLGIENGMAIAVQSVMNKVNTGSTLTSPSLTIAD